MGKLHKIRAISTFSTNIRPAQCLPHVRLHQDEEGWGGKALAEGLNGIMLRWEWQSTGGQGIHMNKVSDVGQVHVLGVGGGGEGLVSSSENEDNSTSLIGRYEDQIKE